MTALNHRMPEFPGLEFLGPYSELIGVSTLCSYTTNVRSRISIAMLDEDKLSCGEQVELIWGEPNGGSANPGAERHAQTVIRAILSERPFPKQE